MIIEAPVNYIVNNISLPINASVKEAFSVASKKLRAIGINSSCCDFGIYRRSIDARKRNDIRFVYSVIVRGNMPLADSRMMAKAGISTDNYTEPSFVLGEEKITSPIVVVGSGPCGLFAALSLAECGFRPILIERGGTVSERREAVRRFKEERLLDTSTNIQFGAGGAGTFSDGKLVTRINDSMSSYVLRRFVEFGAPDEILYLAKPHIGTDILSTVVDRMIERIEELGGEVRFHTELLDFDSSAGRINRARTNRGDINCSAVILAVGHSARNTYETLIGKGMNIIAKPFSVGMRIEHLAKNIDIGMYGDLASHPLLPHAEYNLSYNTKARGVYTFCMCPGGEVVAAASEEGGVVVNGMSSHARDGINSNSAVLCTVFKEDYGSTPIGAIEYQRHIERAAFKAGGGDYSAPICTVGDFLRDSYKTEPYDVIPTYMDGRGARVASPSLYLPKLAVEHIKRGIMDFDRKIPGFASDGAILSGAETRTSAPVRIVRDNETGLADGYTNLYPCGEGAGYAGGITSAAIDGIRTAMKVINRFKP